MQPQIRHHRCHDRAAAELAATLHIRAADSEHLVTVDDAALLVNEKAAVGIAVECNTNIVAARNDLGGKIIKMRRTAVVVDVYAVRLAVDKVTETAETSEQLRRSRGRCAIRAVHKQPKAGKVALDRAGKMVDVSLAGLT